MRIYSLFKSVLNIFNTPLCTLQNACNYMSLPRKLANKLVGVGDKARSAKGDFKRTFGGEPADPAENIGGEKLRRKAAKSIRKSEEEVGPEKGFFDFDSDSNGKNDFSELESSLRDSGDNQLDRRLF